MYRGRALVPAVVTIALCLVFCLSQRMVFADCLSFDGIDDYVQVPDSPRLSGGPGRSVSVEAWVLPTEFPTEGYAMIISKYLDWNNKDWSLFIDQQGYLAFKKETWSLPGCQRGDWSVWSSESIPANEWTHVAFVFDNDNDVVNVFVNGILEGTRDLVDCDLPDTNAVVWIGGPGPFYYPDIMFSGYVDEVRVWDVALTEEQVLDRMLTGLTCNETGLVAYWGFEMGQDSSVLYDSSDESNDGTIHGASWSEQNSPRPESCTDADEDGYSTECGGCGPIDCDDTDSSVNPGATEICNGVDDNCDGNTDDVDADQDGHITEECGGDDCDDSEPSVNPSAIEECGQNTCSDDLDNDCDEVADSDDPDCMEWCATAAQASTLATRNGMNYLALLLLPMAAIVIWRLRLRE